MIAKRAGEPVRVAFLLVPDFSMMAFSAALEPLRSANRMSGQTLFQWQLMSGDGHPVTASNAIPLPVDGAIAELEKADMLVVCGGLEAGAVGQKFHHHLRRLARHGTMVGGLSSGAFMLAEAGLLGNRRFTVHWEYAELFRARYPDLKVSEDLFVIDKDVFTCSGGTAGLDMMLHFVGRIYGSTLAVSVAEQFIHPLIRTERDRQRAAMHSRHGIDSPILVQVIELMESTLEEPLDLGALASEVGISARQIERLFRDQLSTSPSAFYLQLRLSKARTLLRHTLGSIMTIATECGFTSTSHFSHAYKRVFGIAPTVERENQAAKGVPNKSP